MNRADGALFFHIFNHWNFLSVFAHPPLSTQTRVPLSLVSFLFDHLLTWKWTGFLWGCIIWSPLFCLRMNRQASGGSWDGFLDPFVLLGSALWSFPGSHGELGSDKFRVENKTHGVTAFLFLSFSSFRV